MSVVISEEKLSIGDAARILSIPAHTLRYWEKEFGGYLSPNRTEGGQRRYIEEDLRRFEVIKTMLKDQGYSIAGARRVLAKGENVQVSLPEVDQDGITRKELIRRLSDIIQREVIDAVYFGSVRATA